MNSCLLFRIESASCVGLFIEECYCIIVMWGSFIEDHVCTMFAKKLALLQVVEAKITKNYFFLP